MSDVDEALAVAAEFRARIGNIGNAIAGLGARLDQLEAARRDLLTPVANIPAIEGLADHD